MKNIKSTFQFISVILISISVFGIISSCSDDEGVEAPVITLESPVAHAYYDITDVIHFHGNVTDNEEVEHIEISVWEEGNTSNIVFSAHLHPGVASFVIDTGFTVTTTDTTEYAYKVVAEDNDGNTTETPDDLHLHINE